MKKLLLAFAIFCLGLFAWQNLYSQTCCSGGVPLANNIGGLPPADKGTFQFSINYDANFLKTLKDDKIKLDDNSRNRTTHSLLLRSAYTFNDKLSAEALFSAVRQQRIIAQGGFEDYTETAGIGDALFMIHYKYFSKSSLEMSFGIGPKIPLGSTNLTDNRGITLNADLQPGAGAWDGLFHHRISQVLTFRPSMVITNLITYRLTGVNNEYLGSQKYEFGDELSILVGASEQTAFLKTLIGYGLNFRYRRANQDKNNDQFLPNTGGQWIFVNPVISWQASAVATFTFSGELPMYSSVIGTQLTPTYRFNIGLFLSLSQKKESINQHKTIKQ